MPEPDLDLGLVERVRDPVSRAVRRTPLLPSERLSVLTGARVLLKCENLQVTGSFKVRGATAAVSLLSGDARREGVVTASAGNHGLGLARAARTAGVPCTVVVPAGAPRVKVAGMESLGASVVHSPHEGYDDTERWVLERAATWGRTFISPYDHPAVAAGNGGTLMLEILGEVAAPDLVIVPCGGGGLSAGVGAVAAARSPRTRIVGVNTDASPGMWLSRRDGRAHTRVASRPTIAEGIEGGVSERSFAWSTRWVHEVATVREATIHEAVGEILRHEHLLVEGSAAAGPAWLLEGNPAAGTVVVVLTGGNIDLERLGVVLFSRLG
jgi:threonine dehydratase